MVKKNEQNAKPTVTEEQQAVQQQLMMYQMMQQQLEELKKQATVLQNRFVEVEATSLALNDIEKTKEGSGLLIPLGSRMYVHGKFAKGDLLVDVGAGIMAKKPLPEAKVMVEQKKKEIESIGENIQKEMIAIVGKMQELGTILQAAMDQGK